MFIIEKVQKKEGDLMFLFILILLLGLGTSALFSASFYYGNLQFNDPYVFLKKQSIFAVIGILLAAVANKVSLDFIKKIIPILILGSFFLIILTFVPGIGSELLGAKRWIIIFGQSFQPSELAKLTLIIYLAHMFSKKDKNINDLTNTVLPPFIIASLLIFLVYLQNDFSTAFFLFFITIAMFFISGINPFYFLFFTIITLPLAGILIFTKVHRVQRIIAFLRPEIDPTGAGYQIIAAKDALIRGGFWGTGLGNGAEKLGGLPEAHSDFVFAVFAEESGFVGVVFIIVLFVLFALKGYVISLRAKNSFQYLLGFGITTSLFYQAIFNIAVVSGLVPATGIPLPFFSSGGSSLIITLVMCGLLFNISKNGELKGNSEI